MSLLGELARRVTELSPSERIRFSEELEKVHFLAMQDLGTSPVQIIQSSNPKYFRLSGENNNAPLWSGADLILYSNSGTTETGRWDGATGNLTSSGTLDGVDLAGFNAIQFVALATSGFTANERVLTGTSNQITVTDGGAGSSVTLSLPQDFDTGADVILGSLTLTNTGLHILDTNASHDLIIAPGSDLTVDRNLTLTTGDAARTITLQGNPTLDDWFNQSVKQAAAPTFGGLTLTGDITATTAGGLDINLGASAGDDFTIDTSSFVVEGDTGNVGIGTTGPGTKLEVVGSSGTSIINIYGGTNLITESSYFKAQARARFGYNGASTSIVIDDAATTKNFVMTLGGSDRLFVRATDGNVGIGTVSPGAKLDLGTQAPGADTPAPHLQMFGAGGNWAIQLASIYDASYVDSYAILNGRLTGGTYAAPTFTGGNNGGNYFRRDGSSTVGLQIGKFAAGAAQSPTALMTVLDSGNVGIGTVTPNANIILDVVSTTKAFRPPVMNTTQRDAVASPQNGMIIWNSTTGQLEDYNAGWAAV